MNDDRVTIQERYTKALSSSHLEVTEERGAIDYMVAAGWAAREGLGVLLYRLATEFDGVRGDQHHAFQQLSLARNTAAAACSSGAAALLAATDEKGQQRARQRMRDAEEVAASAEHAALTEKALILVRLSTLDEARQALGIFAIKQATIQRFMRDNAAVLKIAGNALAAWLDPLCAACQGRGFNGGYRAPVVLCQVCDGSRRRRVTFGNDDPAYQFGRMLLTQMDRKTERVSKAMSRFMAQRGATDPIEQAAAVRALKERLNTLRSTEAGRD